MPKKTFISISIFILFILSACSRHDDRSDVDIVLDSQSYLIDGNLAGVEESLEILRDRGSECADLLEADLHLARGDLARAELSLKNVRGQTLPEMKAARNITAISIAFAKSENPSSDSYDSLRRADPRQTKRIAGLLRAALEKSDFDSAYRLGMEVVDDSSCSAMLAEVLLQALERKRPDVISSYCDRFALSKNPDSEAGNFAKAIAEFYRKRYGLAAKFFSKSGKLVLSPKAARLCFISYKEAGEFSAAVDFGELLAKSGDKFKESSIIVADTALSAIEMGNIGVAKRLFVVAQNMGLSDALVMKMNLDLKLLDFASAEKASNLILKKDPLNFDANIARAQIIYAKSGAKAVEAEFGGRKDIAALIVLARLSEAPDLKAKYYSMAIETSNYAPYVLDEALYALVDLEASEKLEPVIKELANIKENKEAYALGLACTAKIDMHVGNFDSAGMRVEDVTKMMPNLARMYVYSAELLEMRVGLDVAESLCRHAMAIIGRNSPIIAMENVRLLLKKAENSKDSRADNLGAAVKILDKLLLSDPNNLNFLRMRLKLTDEGSPEYKNLEAKIGTLSQSPEKRAYDKLSKPESFSDGDL